MAAAANVAPENQYFYEDVVYRMDKRGNVVFGIVMENDDLDLSEESSDNEENLPKRKKGEIRMIWHPSGVEELVNCKKVPMWGIFFLRHGSISLRSDDPMHPDVTCRFSHLLLYAFYTCYSFDLGGPH